MTALTFSLTNTVSATNSTAQKALENASAGATLTNLNTNLTAGTTGWVTLYGKGNGSAQTGAGSQPALADNGWLDDATTLVGNHYTAGTWSFSIPLEATAGTITADIHIRFFQRTSGGTRTLIAEAVATSQSITSSAFLTVTGSVSGSASATFASGDVTGIDVTANITANSGGGNIRVQMASSSTLGNTSAQVVTPGYVSTSTAQKKFVTRLYQYAVAQHLFKTRFFQYVQTQKKWKTRFFQYDFRHRWATRFYQYVTTQKKWKTRFKQVGQVQHTFATRFGQYDATSTSQMLYDDLQQQYIRIRTSPVNALVDILAIVYYTSAQILSEHAVPGELDVLLIGENLATDLHVLRTIADVTAFLEENMPAQTIYLQTSQLITATSGNSGNLPVGGYKELAIDINISGKQGTSPTIQFFVDRIDAAGQANNLWTSSVISSTPTAISQSIGAGLTLNLSLGATILYRWVITGSSTPGWTYSVSLIAK